MICKHCGIEIDGGTALCPACAIAQTDNGETAPATSPRPKRRRLLFLIPALAVLLAVCAGAFFVMLGSSPARMLGRALDGWQSELIQRLDSTPLGVLPRLAACMENGTIDFDLQYTDAMIGEAAIHASLQSDGAARSYALFTDVSLDGVELDATLYMNRERLALHASLLDDQFYGVTYDTFRDDIRPFGALVGLDDETAELLAAYVDLIAASMNADGGIGRNPYTDRMSEFLTGLKPETGRADIGVSCTTICFTVSAQDFVGLLRDFHRLLEQDSATREQYNAYAAMVGSFYFTDYDAYLHTLDLGLDHMEGGLTGSFSVTFYIDGGDRLARAVFAADLAFDDEPAVLELIFDTGTQAGDAWSLHYLLTVDTGYALSADVFWDVAVGDASTHNLHLSYDSGFYSESLDLTSRWNPDSGDFTLAVSGAYESPVVSGHYTTDGGSFRLAFGDLAPGIRVSLSGSTGVVVADPAFVNLDRWDMELIDLLNDAFSKLMRF